MTVVRDLLALVRDLLAETERRFHAWSRRVLLAPHRPEQNPDDGMAWCLRCRSVWPCAAWMRLDR